MKKVLMVALDFPPCQSAGVQRTLYFKKYLERNEWLPLVLTAKPLIYDKLNVEQLSDDAFFGPTVFRAFGLNALKHLSFKGKHFEFTTFPDRFSTWRWDGVRLGKKILASELPELLWTTFPCSTSMRIGLQLKKASGLPWVADFRDPFSGTNPYVRARNPIGKGIDEEVVRLADKLIFTTQNAADVYLTEYPFLDKSKIEIIANGYDESVFSDIKLQEDTQHTAVDVSEFTVLHSGFLYPGGRDIESLIEALRELRNASFAGANRLKIIFRGGELSSKMALRIKQYGLEKNVVFLPTIPFAESIKEMQSVDALLVLQGEIFNNQIPGKIYEYVRSKRPIIALTHEDGATAKLCQDVPHAHIADMNDPLSIKLALQNLLESKVDQAFDPALYSRDIGAKKLLHVLDSLMLTSVSKPGMVNQSIDKDRVR
ncbi:hypothetical protein A9Q81_11400 [Gammaproteobacteria bacterium 42_54_T18]|nr:hypothetical protein A9Q81_11400 [Gammaproteobacteria bacterium 42_54_T18]